MPSVKLGSESIQAPGYGAMGLSFGFAKKSTPEEAEVTLNKAIDLGCTFWDTAVVYGAGANEKLIGDFLRKHNARDKVFLASKCGIKVNFETQAPEGTLNSAEHINSYIEGTIERLGGPPDLYYLHRIEKDRDLNESIGALDGLRRSGKTKYIGLSECSAATLRKANAIAHIDAVQAELSPFFDDHLLPGGLYDTCKELGVAFVAYSPLGKGFLTGAIKSYDDMDDGDFRKTLPRYQPEVFDKNFKIVDELNSLAKKKGCTSGQICLAWLASLGVIAIPGTKSADRLAENVNSREITLTAEEIKEIQRLIKECRPEGERYTPAHMAAVGN